MTTLGEAFLMFMLREYTYEKNLFLVVEKVRRIFNCEIAPAVVRGWFKLFESEGDVLKYINYSHLLKAKSKRINEWFHPSNASLTIMCKEFMSYRADLEFRRVIGKTLYEELWVSYTENSYKFERRYEIDDTNDKTNKMLIQVWWESSGTMSFMSPISENLTLQEFCHAIHGVCLHSYLIQEATMLKHIFIIDCRNPLLSDIRTCFANHYHVLALPPNYSDITPMNHPFDKLYDQFRQYLERNKCSTLDVIRPAFHKFCRENMYLFESVFNDFYTSCVLYMRMRNTTKDM